MSMKETNTKKTILRVALAAAAVLLFCGAVFVGGVAGDHPSQGHGGWTPVTSEDNLPTTEGDHNLYLNADKIELTKTWTVPKGTTNLCLNGMVIKRADGASGNFSLITVPSGATLNLYDCGTTTYTFRDNGQGLWVLDGQTGTQHSVTGGCITGGTGTHNSKGTYSGGGVYVAEGGTFNMTGGNIVGNSATWGGGVYVNGDNSAKGKFTMTGGNITGNSAIGTSSGGGGVNVDKGTFEMSGGSIRNNTAQGTSQYSGGGGVRVNESGEFTMSGNALVTGNTAKGDGGGVLVRIGATFKMSGNALVTGNTSDGNGGGVCVKSTNDSGTVIETTFEMTDGSITGNTANYGGGVMVLRGSKDIGDVSKTKFTMSGGTIGGTGAGEGNTATTGGGGVNVDRGTFTMSAGSIAGNNAKGSNQYSGGGGVRINDQGTFTMSGSASITGNTSNSNGGGVLVRNKATFAMSGGSIGNNTAANGGGVYVRSDATAFNVSGTPKISGNTNKATTPKPNNVYLVDGRTITLVNKTGSDNTSLETGAEIRIIYPLDTTKSFATGSESHTVTANDAKFFFPDRDPDKYLAAVTTSSGSSGAASTLGWVAPTAKLETKTADSTVTTYYATVADAVANAKTGDGTTNQVTMLKDSTESTVTVGTTVTLDLHGCVLNGTGSGSVISVSSTGNLTVTDSKPNSEHHFNKNSTPWVWDSTENSGDVVKGGCITGGSADSGGGVYVNGGTLNMTGGNIVGNKATSNDPKYGGGGVYMSNGTFEMRSNALVVGNYAYRGGGVRVDQGTFEMSGNASITGNTAEYSGGVYLDGGTFNMTGGSISNNKATGSGGGVGVNGSAEFNMSGSASIRNNTTPTGGGVLVMSSSKFNMSGNAIIEGNEVTGTVNQYGGGGVRVLQTATFSMSDTARIINNTSAWGGGGVYVQSGTFEMKGNALVVGNSAASGGGVRVDDGTFNVSGSPKITGNMDKASTPKANNVYLATGKYITIKGNFNGEISIYTAGQPFGQFGTADDASYTGAAHFISDYIRTDEGHSGEHYVGVQDTSEKKKWVWKSDSTKIYTITVDNSGISHGEITPSAASAAEGISIQLAITPKPGYDVKSDSAPTFTVTKKNGGTVDVDNNFMFMMPLDDVTVTGFATCSPKTYTVTLNPLGGTGGTASVTATYDAAMPSITPPTKTGYSFAGYFDATSDGKQYYDANGTSANTWDKASDTTLYAQWTPKQTTVTLNPNGGTSGTPTTVTATYDAAMDSITPPTRSGYTFEGYYDSDAATDGTKYYSAAGTSERTWDKEEEKAILYAHWTGDKYSVTFDKNTGTTEADPKTIDETYGTYYIFPTTDPTKTGYDFAGWWTAADGGTQITIDTMVEITAAQTLYAHWAPTISGKIKFDETEYDSPADITAEYNGNGQTGHILEAFSDIPESDGYKISWCKNSQVVNGISKTQTITNVSDSGTWTAKLLTNEGAETGQSVTATVTVNPRSVDQDDIVIGDITDIPWVKGSGPFAPASLSVTDNGNALTEGADKDYTAAYSENTEVTANAKATITGQKNYKDSKEATYRIVLSINADGTNLQDVLDYIAQHPTVSSDLVICPESITLSSEIKTTPSDATKAIISTILGKVTEGTISNFTLEVKPDGSNIAAVIGLVDTHSGVKVSIPNPVTIPEGTKITVTANNKGVVNDLISKADDASKITLIITDDNLSVAADIFGTPGVKDKNVKAETNALTIDTTDKLTAMGTILANVNPDSKPGLADNSTVITDVLSNLTTDGKKIVKELYDSATDSTKKSTYQPYLTSTVSFDALGGSACTQQTVTYDKTYGTLPTTTKTGYDFAGWFTAATDGTQVTADTKVTAVEDHTLYAHWTLNNYDITVPTLAHGFVTWAIVQSNDSAPYGTTILITATPETGYQLKDGSLKVYKTGSSTETVTVTDNKFTMPAYGVTITAEFEPKQYAIAYELDGGTAGDKHPTSETYDAVSEVSAPTKDGHTFTGWKVAGSDVNYTTAKYGTSESSVETAVTADTKCIGTDASSSVWFKNLSTTAAGSVTLTATWSTNDYTITVDSAIQHGTISCTEVPSNSLYGTTIQITATPATGYQLKEGSLKVYKTGDQTKTAVVDIAEDNTFTMPAYGVTITAEFIPKTYTVTLSQTDATTPGTTSFTATYDSAAHDTITNPARTGYTFAGWYTTAETGGVKVIDTNGSYVDAAGYVEGGVWKHDANITLYAKWTLNEYDITVPTLDHGSVSWAIVQSNDSVPYGTTILITATPETGYQLKDGSLKVYKTGDQTKTVDITEDNTFTMPDFGVTITAVFEPKEYTVTFNVQGHGTAPAGEPVKFGGKVPQPAAPSAAGLTFDGWYKEPDCITLWNFNSDTVAGDMTLYAKWVFGSYTVKFDGNGGTISSGSETSKTISARYGDTIQLLKAERGEYTHTGWALTRDGPSVYAPSQNVQDLGDITLYAVWTKNQEILYEISVTVQMADGTSPSGVTVELKQGNAVLASDTTSADGRVSFNNVTKGIYNLVAKTAEGKIKTEEVTITDSSKSVPITIPVQGVSSVVEVSAKAGTPAVVVGGADEEAETKAESEKFVTITVKVEAKTPGDTAKTEEKTQEEIRKIVQISGGTELQHLGLTVEKTVTDSEGKITEHKQLENTDKVLEFIIPYDFAHKNKVTVYRCHNNAAEPLTRLDSKPVDYRAGQDKTFWLDMDNGRIYIYANLFSTYSVGYYPERSSGGSSGTSTWISTIPSVPADNIVATDVTNQYAGQKFIPVSAANLEQISAAAPSAAAWVEGVLETATAHGIRLTNSKGAKALINTTESVAGLQTEVFAQVIDVESADGSKVTSVPFKVRLSDLAAKNLTTDDVTLYHYLEEYGLWIPLETWLVSTDSAYANYGAATDGASPFGVLLKKLDAPEVQPVPTKTPAGKSPVPFMGVIAGLGAAAVVFGLRMRRK